MTSADGTPGRPFDETNFNVLAGLAAPAELRREILRAKLAGPSAVVVPGATDALMARLCERNGFDAVYLTGAGVSNSHLALPDVGLVSLDEMLFHAQRIFEATTIPLIVDADNGYGGPIAAARTFALYERAGASGVQFEDQGFPKRCGHFDGKTLVPMEEMQAKIDAAVRARVDPDTLVIARTDARAIEGFDAAIARSRGYLEAGADVIFVEAPETEDEVAAVPALFPGIPTLINVVEGGKTPISDHATLGQNGYSIILHANYLLRASLSAADHALSLLRKGLVDVPENFLSWDDRQTLVRLSEFDSYEDELRMKWQWSK